VRVISEISAGGVFVRQGADGLEVVLISVRGGKRWALPKGRQDGGETLAETALREAAEETGLRGRIIAPLGSMDFDFVFIDGPDSEKRHKIVHFFLMENTGGDIKAYDRVEISDCRWFPIQEAAELLRFEDERDIVYRAESLFLRHEGDKIDKKTRE